MQQFRLVEPITVRFPDKERHMRLTMYGLRKAEYKLAEIRGEKRKSIYAIINDELKSIGEFSAPMDFFSVILWAAALEEEPDLELEVLERQVHDQMTIFQTVLDLVRLSFFGGKDVILDVPNGANSDQGAESASPLSETQPNGAVSGHSPS